MSETREVKTWRKVYYVSRAMTEDQPEFVTMLEKQALSELPENLLIIDGPHVVVSRPNPGFEYSLDDEGNKYRNPDAVLIDFRVVEL
jgi:hypothetical protein